MSPIIVAGLCLGCALLGVALGRLSRSRRTGRTSDPDVVPLSRSGSGRYLTVLEDQTDPTQNQRLNGDGVASMGDAIVKAEGLVKKYRTSDLVVPALRGVDIEIGRGEFVALVGPSGNGKSTLRTCLSGIESIDSGQVWVDGRELHEMSQAKRAAHRAEHMGFVFQSFNLINVLSAQENVELPLLVTGVKVAEARRRSGELLDRVGLGGRRDHRPGELSGGEQQRVAVARALATDPAVIWADEPTGNLDSATADQVVQLFEEVSAQGQSVVLVTHDPEVASRADRIVRILDGRVAHDGRSRSATGSDPTGGRTR